MNIRFDVLDDNNVLLEKATNIAEKSMSIETQDVIKL